MTQKIPDGWKWNQWEEVVRDIRDSYGDLKRPSRNFVLRQDRLNMYEMELVQLSGQIPITWEVEPNESVCLVIELPGTADAALYLSLVGKYFYAAVRSESGLEMKLEYSSGSSPELAIGSAMLTRLGVLNLNRRMLLTPTVVHLPGIENPTTFHALFFPEEENLDVYLG